MVHALAVPTPDRFVLNPPAARPSAVTALVERARARLRTDPHRLINVSCDYDRGALRLRGEVPSYYLKQVAQTLLLSLSSGHPIRNELTVIP